jgi:hypothetical protein
MTEQRLASASGLGPAEIGPDGALASCPECGGRQLRCVTDGELTNFFCAACACCWHLELGWVHRVDPATCPGCRFQPLCLASRVPHRTRPQDAPAAGRR